MLMEQFIIRLNDNIKSNSNNILNEIAYDLQQLIKNSKDQIIIKTLGGIINKINNIIEENKKNVELIRNDINKINDKIDELLTTHNKELKNEKGKYVGEIKNGKREGKGIFYFKNGDTYEGDWKNDKMDGKGIYYHKKADGTDRYEGDFRNDKRDGKGIVYFRDGNRYEGDFRNGRQEGKGVYYFNDGDRMMGDYLNGDAIGKHAILTKDGKVGPQIF